jgi:hypothetical protein
MRFGGHMACIKKGGFRTVFWWGIRKERDQLKDLGLDKKIILKRISKK